MHETCCLVYNFELLDLVYWFVPEVTKINIPLDVRNFNMQTYDYNYYSTGVDSCEEICTRATVHCMSFVCHLSYTEELGLIQDIYILYR